MNFDGLLAHLNTRRTSRTAKSSTIDSTTVAASTTSTVSGGEVKRRVRSSAVDDDDVPFAVVGSVSRPSDVDDYSTATTGSAHEPIDISNFDPSRFAIAPAHLALGEELAEKVRHLCATNTDFQNIMCKTADHWGVVLDSDIRLTGTEFGDYKSPTRKFAESELLDYMLKPSRTRSDSARDTAGDYQVAMTMAPPGTGKSRFLDDAMRMPLQSPHFDHFLRFAITFNGKTSGAFKYPVSVRVLFQFFCTGVPVNVLRVLGAIDEMLSKRFEGKGEFDVSLDVLNAVEALYFHQRGGKLGRTVLMVDEISKADFVPSNNKELLEIVAKKVDRKHVDELAAYRIVAEFVDSAWLTNAYGRRGAVVTALDYVEPGLAVSSSGRSLRWLPLGTFDVWSDEAQAAIAADAMSRGLLRSGETMHVHVWSLLAASGGRPRDISSVLSKLTDAELTVELDEPSVRELTNALFSKTESNLFEQYLLPSMLTMEFTLRSRDSSLTQFGVDCASPELLNADLFVFHKMESNIVGLAQPEPAPMVSLRYALDIGEKTVRTTMVRLIEATAFCSLDGSGKDFERAWVLLVFSHLLLQFNVRVGRRATFFWPSADAGRQLGGPERPTATAIDVFESANRIDALFAMPLPTRVHKAQSIQRQIQFLRFLPPTLAVWKDLWVPDVLVGVPPSGLGWSMATCDVVWRASTVVYFSEVTHLAIDFMLLVGDANGTGDARPHVYMFQCKALAAPVTQGSATSESVTVESIVRGLEGQLELLFSRAFDGHVLRRAGIKSAEQVTLCINALQFGARVDASKLTAQFGVVLFDEEEFGALGGTAFANTRFFRFLAQRPKPAAKKEAAATQASAEAAESPKVRPKRKRATKASVDGDAHEK